MDNNPSTPLLDNINIETDDSSYNDNISTDSIKECWICKEIVDTHINF